MSEIYELEEYTSYDEDGPYFDPYAPCYDDEPNDLWGMESDYEYWENECSYVEGQGCLKAGSEECDFECPFHNHDYDFQVTRLRTIGRWVLNKLPCPLQAWWYLMIEEPQQVASTAEEFYSCMSSSHNVYSSPWDKYLLSLLYDEIPF